MKKSGKDSEIPAPLIAPKTLHHSLKSILSLFHFLKYMLQLLEGAFCTYCSTSEESILFLTVARKECLVKLFTLSLYCTCCLIYCILELNVLKDCSAFWFGLKNFQMYFL